MDIIKYNPPTFITSRAIAAIIDYGLFYAFFYTYIRYMGIQTASGEYMVYGITNIFFIMVIWFLYFPFLESILGYTLGKGLFDLIVVDRKGNKAGLGQTLKRHLLDIIDFFFFGVVAALSVTFSQDRKRFGDKWAKTFVINENILKNNNDKRVFEQKDKYYQNFKFYIKIAYILQIFTLVMGLIYLSSLLFGLGTGDFVLKISILFPGLESLHAEDQQTFAFFLLYFISICMLLGGLSFFKNNEYLNYFLVISWAMVTFGFRVDSFLWWPVLFENISYSFGFKFFFDINFKLNLFPLFFFMWSVIKVYGSEIDELKSA